MEFFNKNKLLLAGYDIDVELNIEKIFNILVSAQTEIQFTHNKETKVICYILDSNEIDLAALNVRFSRNSTAAVVKKLAKLLVKKRFGDIYI